MLQAMKAGVKKRGERVLVKLVLYGLSVSPKCLCRKPGAQCGNTKGRGIFKR